MTTQAPNSTAITGGIKTSDPRIVSPEIKVIYPSENAHKDLQIAEQQTTAPVAQVLPTAPLSTIETPKETTTESTVVTKETTTPPATEPAKVSTWKDTLKEHAVLFIAVALISVGIGVLIGKKM